jgi:hypothetical protein
MLTNFYYKFLNTGFYSSSSFLSPIYFIGASDFLNGGTNFLRTDVPFGRMLADTNSPGGTTLFAF